jgi:hypothetical protein
MIRALIQEKNRNMKFRRALLTFLAVCSVGAVLPRMAAADEWDKRTTLTFSKAVEIPGKVLPAGTYVFQLADSPVNRHAVEVFAQDGRILAIVFTIPTARPTATDETRIMFDEQRASAPAPIKKWFYPGELGGEEFIYRHKRTVDASTN